MKPRVLLIPDKPDWAFDIRADYLIKYLSEYYDFTKIIFSQIQKRGKNSINWEDFDCIFLFYWKHFRIWKFHPPKEKISTGIFSFCSIEDTESYISSEINKFKALIISTPLLGRFYSLHPNVFYVSNGVDENVFFPKNISTKEFTIGWAGDPEYCGGKDRKGVYGVLTPVAKDLSINLELALDIPHSDMVDFYNKLDVYVCVAEDEGTPNPILEAQACGIPVISTRVGIAQELIKDGYNGFLIDRTTTDLALALEKLRDNPGLCQVMAKNAREEILKNWTYKDWALGYKEVFDFVIDNKNYKRRKEDFAKHVVRHAAQQSVERFRQIITTYEKRGILHSEMLAVCAVCDQLNIEVIIESGRARGQSTYILAKYFKDTHTKIVSIDWRGSTWFNEEDDVFARERLASFQKVGILYGNSSRVIPKLLGDLAGKRIAVLLDGPKEQEAIKLLRVLTSKHSNILVAFLHDTMKGTSHRQSLEDTFSRVFFTDDEEYVKSYTELDNPCIEKGRWRPHWIKSYGHIESYGPTLSVIFPTEEEKDDKKNSNSLAKV